ncbi:hypothetical protein D3C71_1826730 [compost metagenome]
MIDGFGVGGLAAQHVDRLTGRQADFEAGILAGHQQARSTLVVAIRVQQVVATGLGSLTQGEGCNGGVGNVMQKILQAPCQAPTDLSLADPSRRQPWRRRAQCQIAGS